MLNKDGVVIYDPRASRSSLICAGIAVDPGKNQRGDFKLCKNAVEARPDGEILTSKGYQKANRVIAVDGDSKRFGGFSALQNHQTRGTGLGLPIGEQILPEHRETVTYISELGKRTTFIGSPPLDLIRID